MQRRSFLSSVFELLGGLCWWRKAEADTTSVHWVAKRRIEPIADVEKRFGVKLNELGYWADIPCCDCQDGHDMTMKVWIWNPGQQVGVSPLQSMLGKEPH